MWSRGIDALKKIQEWSEIVAGPRWKTFIWRFNRNKSFSRQPPRSNGSSRLRAQFQRMTVAKRIF
ncbi:hypothetical protein Ccrd_023690 [Cynara cardunculus var. scolymus]|uniref:Uncharacterized protein n=1 Tax=Cynara cardunculus var. scolymus TaxID=59895 RepID=A0A103XWC8_CYNCS|nr:hypothetical protein Ccrd_023690 [Cynara cardunculus var. scolymus]